MINKQCLKMVGLKKAVGEMPGLNYSGAYLQVNYDVDTGEIITNYHVSLGHNSWTQYDEKNIIRVGDFESATMQALADRIVEAVAQHECSQSEALY